MAANEVRIKLAVDGTGEAVVKIDQVTGGLDKLDSQAKTTGSSSDTLRTALAGIATAGTALAVIKMADSVSTLHTQLRLSTGSSQSASQAYEALYQIAQKSRVSFTELGSTYATIARAGQELGIGQNRLLAVTQSISQAMTIGGGSAQSMQAALVQLSQGLSSGTLRGEELNSIMEQTPRLAKAIADGLGVPIGELRKLGETGQLTAQQVIGALEKSGPQLAKEMASATLTVGQAFTMLQNSTTKLIGDMDGATGASVTLANAMQGVASVMDTVGSAIRENETSFGIVAKGLAGGAVLLGLGALAVKLYALVPAIAAVGAAWLATPLAPVILALAAVAAGVMGVKTAAESIARSQPVMEFSLRDLDARIALLAKSNEAATTSGIEQLEKYRAARKRVQADLALMSIKGLDTSVEDARFGASTAAYKAREKVAKDLLAVQMELSGVDANFQTHLSQLKAGLDAGLVSEENYVKDVIALIAKEGGARKASTGLSDAAKGLTLYNDLVAKSGGLNADFAEKWALLNAAFTTRKIKVGELINAQKELLKEQEFSKDAEKAHEEQTKASNKATKEATEARQNYAESLGKYLSSIEGENEKLQDHIDRLGLSKTAVAELDAAKLESQATIQDLIVLKKIEQGLDEEQYEIYVRTAAELRKRAELTRQAASKSTQVDDARDAAKASLDEWKHGWQETERLGREVFTVLTSDAQRVGDVFKKTMLSAAYEIAAKPLAIQLYTSVVGAPPGASGATGNALGTASSLNSLSGGSLMPTVTLGGSTLAAIAGSVSTGFQAGWAGTNLSAAISAYTAAGQTGVATGLSVGSSVGSTLAAIPGWGWAAMAAIAVATIFNNKQWETKYGGAFDNSGPDGTVAKLYGPGTGGEFADQFAQKALKATETSINAVFAKVGSATRVGYFSAGAESSKEGEAFSYAGGKLSSGAAFGQVGSDFNRGNATPEEATKALVKELQQSTLQALQAATDVPKAISDRLAGIDIDKLEGSALDDLTKSVNAIIDNVTGLQNALAQWPLEITKNLSFDAAAALIEFSGGLDKLGNNLQGYYQNFYDAGERQAQTLKNINAVLGDFSITFTEADVAAADARKTFRDLVEGVKNVNTETGQRTLAALLSVQGAFADVTQEVKATTSALSEQTDAQRALQAAWSAEGARLDELVKKSTERRLAVQELRDEATESYLAAQKRVTEAQQGVADVLHSTIRGFKDFLDGLDGAQAPVERLDSSRQNYRDLIERARSGDTEAVGKLTTAAQPLLQLSKQYSATIQDYRRDEAMVRNVLKEGIAAGEAQLAKLPVEMRQATDPLKSAYAELERATAAESTARTLAIAMRASLTSTEKSLGDKYLEAIKGMPDEKELEEFFTNTMAAASAAKTIAEASAAAAQTILAKLAGSTTTTTTTTTAGGGASTASTTTGNVTYTPGLVGGGIYSNLKDVTGGSGNSSGTGSTFVAKVGTTITTDGMIRRDSGEYGTQLFWARDVAAILNDYSVANGKDAAISIAAQYGLEGAMLDQVRRYSVGVPQFARGINQVPHDMLALIHEDERVLPAADNRELMTRLASPRANSDALAAELNRERAKNAELASDLFDAMALIAMHVGETADNTLRVQQLLEKFDEKGMPPVRA